MAYGVEGGLRFTVLERELVWRDRLLRFEDLRPSWLIGVFAKLQ
jgi:hypothetical protein